MATSNMQQGQAMQLIAPDIAQEQNQLMRRQQLADLLRKQSFEPAGGTEMVGGWAVKKSPFEALGKMAQALSANYVQDQTDKRQLELAKALQGRMGDILGGGQGSTPQIENRTNDDMGPQMGTAAPQAPGTAAPQNNFTMANLLKGQVISDLGGTGAGTAFWDDMKRTEAGKRDRELGIGSAESRTSELAKRLKEGTMSLLPGQTNVMPTGERVVAPNFDTGVAGGFDKQGNPVATEIPKVAAIAASRAEGIKTAEAGVADRFAVPDAVDAATGKVALTPTQRRAAANGGIDPAYPAPAPAPSMFRTPNAAPAQSLPPPQPATSNFQGDAATIALQIRDIKDPQERANATAAFEAQARKDPNFASNPRATVQGIPLKSAEQTLRDEARVKLETQPSIDRNIQTAKDMAEYEKNLNGHLSESQALLQRIGQSREALTKFTAGGGGETRGKLASLAQAIPGMPRGVVDGIAGGDLSALQEFQKYAAQEALGTMQQALASDTGKGAQGNRVAMQLFIKNNPNVDTDPRAIEKIFNFQTTLHNRLLDQSNAYQEYKKDPSKDLSAFPNEWANKEIKDGHVTPDIKLNYAKGNVQMGSQSSMPANVKTLLDKYK